MVVLVGCAALLAQPVAAQTDEFEVRTEQSGRAGSSLRINFSVKNNSGRSAKNVFLDCTAFDAKDSPMDTQLGLVQNVKAGEKAFGKVSLTYMEGMKGALCRFSHASY
jgi:hypothetical protein